MPSDKQNIPLKIVDGLQLGASYQEILKPGETIIASNGMEHALNSYMSPHCWGTAVNVYRIGNQHLNSQDRIEKYSEMIRNALPAVWVRPYGTEPGTVFDQLHIDLGYTTVSPHSI